MSIKYLLTTTTADNKIVVADQIPANSIGSGQVDSSIALQSSLDAAIKGLSPKGSVRTILDLPQLSNSLPTPSFTWSGGGQTLTSTTNFTLTGVSISGVTDLVAGDKVLITFSTADKKYAGIYVITDAGVADPGGSPVVFTRASNFNESAEVLFGAYVVVNAGDYVNQIWYLQTEGAITLNTTALVFAHWGETGASYTAGNFIDLTGNAIAVKLANSGSALHNDGSGNLDVYLASGSAITNAGSGLDVRNADSSYRGTVSSAEWGVVTGSGQYGKNYDITNTAVTRTTDLTPKTFSSPYGTLGANKSALVEVTVVSRSVTVDGSADVTGTCIQKWAFTLARGASHTAVLDSVQLFKSGTSNILGCTVAMQVAGLSGADAIAVTGVLGSGGSTTIDHNVSIVCRTL
jgi:hypothetical protein